MQSHYFHSSAIVESAEIGEGTSVWAFAHVLPHAQIGSNCNIGDHAFIEGGAVVGDRVTIKNHVCVWDGVTIEDDVFIGPAAIFTNDLRPRSPRMPAAVERYASKENWLTPTVVEQGATIGAGAIIIAGVRLGRYCFVAAGATVTRDVRPFTVVRGTPAKPTGFACRCGRPLEAFPPLNDCAACGATTDFFEQQLTTARTDDVDTLC